MFFTSSDLLECDGIRDLPKVWHVASLLLQTWVYLYSADTLRKMMYGYVKL